MKHQAKDKGPLGDLKEWQEHRYDVGHFMGGNIHPLLKAARPNKYGYLLILGGLGILIIVFFGRNHMLYWYYAALQMCVALLMITAGVKLIKRPSRGRWESRKRSK